MCPHHCVALRGSCISLFVTDDVKVLLNYNDIVLTLLSLVDSCTVYITQGWPLWILSSSLSLRPFGLLAFLPSDPEVNYSFFYVVLFSFCLFLTGVRA